MTTLVNLFAASGIFLLILVGAYARFRLDQDAKRLRRLLPLLVIAIGLLGLHLATSNLSLAGVLGSSGLIWAGNALLITAFGLNPLGEIHDRQPQNRLIEPWLIFCLGWIVVMVMAIGNNDVDNAFNTRQLAAAVGLAISGAYLLIVHIYIFARSTNAELSNRALFWLIILFLCYGGCLLSASETPFLVLPGLLMVVSSIMMTVYIAIEKRILDLRIGLIFGLRAFVLTLLASVAIFTALYIGQEIRLDNTQATLAILGLIALVTALFYTPIEQVLNAAANIIIARFRPNLVAILREYSQIISQATTLEEVAEKGTTHLNRLLRVQNAALILINDTGRRHDAVELLVMRPPEENQRAFLSKVSPIYEALAIRQQPLLQSDIELGAYRSADDEDNFLEQLNMRAYAPITLEKSLIGIVACGPKRDGSIFNSDDLNILYALAQQVGIALRNARLIDDLQHLNNSMRSLNQSLAQAKQELEKLDSVKTDFITIASHELRTPLAQIRGYTDILESLNEQGLLDADQTRDMMANLRKATERIEELIAAMLDVSQLDVNAMDLRFIETSPETIVKLAIEPLTDAIFRRRIAFAARGLKGLPTFYGDLQRLVQAFRNVIVNAIKFTPDEGQIEITAELIRRDEPNSDFIRFQIRDSGVGIAPEHIEFIFDKFYRGYDPSLHSTGTYKFMGAGPGLGLTIARGIIEGHGGKIWAESPGHNMQTFPGSTFYIELPLIPPKSSGLVLTSEDDKKRATREMRTLPTEANA